MGDEVLICTEQSAVLWSVGIFDLESGTCLFSHKGDPVSPRCLCITEDGLVFAAIKNKPFISSWVLGKKEIHEMRSVTPGSASCLVISSDAVFCAGSFEDSLILWQVCSGRMVRRVEDSHPTNVSSLIFSQDGSLLVSGALDGSVHVWEVAELVESSSTTFSNVVSPLTTITSASDRIQTLDISHSHDPVLIGSAEATVYVWKLPNGQLLQRFVSCSFSLISCVALDTTASFFVCGTRRGELYRCELFKKFSKESMKEQVLEEKHLLKASSDKTDEQSSVTGVCVSCDGLTVIAGFTDGRLLVLKGAKQRLIPIRDAITNLKLLRLPPTLYQSPCTFQMSTGKLTSALGEPSSVFEGPLQRGVQDDSIFRYPLRLNPHLENTEISMLSEKILSSARKAISYKLRDSTDKNSRDDVETLLSEVHRLRHANKDLFQYALSLCENA